MRALWGRLLRTPVSVLLHCPPGGSTPAAHPPSLRFEVAGLPAADRMFIFDGDYVDRGAWGLEIVLLLAAWALAAPRAAYLVRGNHESKYTAGGRAGCAVCAWRACRMQRDGKCALSPLGTLQSRHLTSSPLLPAAGCTAFELKCLQSTAAGPQERLCLRPP